jgi:predicted transcriptional regulator
MAMRIPEAAKAKGQKTKPMNFRLPDDVIKQLNDIADTTGHTRTAILCYAIRYVHKEWLTQRAKDKGAESQR